MSEQYLARGPMCFGIGETVPEAIKHMRQHWSSDWTGKRPNKREFLKDERLVEVFHSPAGGMTIDQMGTVHYPDGARKLDHQEWLDLLYLPR